MMQKRLTPTTVVVLFCAAIAVAAFFDVAKVAATSFLDTFKVGDRVEVSVSGLVEDKYYEPCVVTEVRDNGYMVVCSNTEYFVRPEWVRRPRAAAAPAPKPAPERDPVPAPVADDQPAGAAFNAGDIVEASISGLPGDEHYETCVITEVLDAKYRVVCSGIEYVVRSAWTRARTRNKLPLDRNNLKEAPSNAPCNMPPPAPPVKNTDRFSADLAKRKIYDNAAMNITGGITAPLKVGVSFITFSAGTSFVNNVTNGQRINDAAPPYTTIYNVKAKHVLCEEFTRTTHKSEVETAYMCFKNRNGEWVCAADGPFKFTPLNY